MAKQVPVELEDGSGGLNLRDPKTAIKPNQFSVLENYITDEGAYLKKRLGQTLIQYAPIDPQPFTSDGGTLGLWHFDSVGAPWTDSGPNTYNLNPAYTGPASGLGLFPIGAGKGAVFTPTTNAQDSGPIFDAVTGAWDNKDQVTIQGWLNINAAFSGQPVPINRFGAKYTVTSTGAVLWATCQFADDGISPGALVNGLSIYRDWDAVNSRDLGNPYITFTLRTKGTPGTVTVLKTGALPFSNWLHVKATYNSSTGKVSLYINGSLEDSATPVGGGLVDDSNSRVISMGAAFNQSYTPTFPMTNGNISQMASVGNTVYVGGSFSLVDGQYVRNNAFAFDLITGNILPWNPNLDGQVLGMVISGGIVYLGGSFHNVNGNVGRNWACAVDQVNGLALPWDPEPSSFVQGLAISGSSIYMVGNFTNVNGTGRNFAAAVDSSTAAVLPWNPNLDALAQGILIYSGSVYLVGSFSNANGGTGRNKACAVDLVNGTLTAWNPNLNAFSGSVIQSGGNIYLAGSFTAANGGTVRNHACCVDSVNGTLTAWNPNASGGVNCLYAANGVIYMGGSFLTVGGVARINICSVDATNGALNSWYPNIPNSVSSITAINGIVLVGSSGGGGVLSFHASLFNVFNGILDEWQAEGTEVQGFPFRNPMGKGMILSKSDGTNQLVVATDAGLYFTIGDGIWTLITKTDPLDGSLISSTEFWDGVQIGDRLYMSNGINSPLTWNGSQIRPTGNPIHPLVVSLSANGNSHTNGSFDYVYTRKYGQVETGPSPKSTVVVNANQDVNIQALETGLEDCTGIVVYRTKANAPGIYFRLRELVNDPTVASLNMSGNFQDNGNPLNDGGADGVPDGTTPSNLHDIAFYSLMLASVSGAFFQNGKYYLTEHDRLFICGISNQPYFLCWSEVGNPDVMTALSFLEVMDDKGPLVGMSSWYGEIVLSKNGKATSILRGTDPSNWIFSENIHPDIGALDHWSFVRRYPLSVTLSSTYQVQSYVLMFLGYDGIYSFNGTRPEKVSDILNPLFVQLQTKAKLSWVSASQALFQAAFLSGGSATQNIQASSYTTDGLRDVPGQIRIVDQLNYIGLWGEQSPLINGNVIAICKGPAEGEFYFSTDADNNVYRTTDNFLTRQVIASPLAVADRFVEMLYTQGIGAAGSDSLWLFTEGTGAGGAVYKLDDPVGAAGVGPNFILANAGPFFWQADIPWQLNAALLASFAPPPLTSSGPLGSQNFYYLGNGGGLKTFFDFTKGLNVDLDHTQNITIGVNQGGARLDIDQQTDYKSASLFYPATYANVPAGQLNLAAGFWGFHDAVSRTVTGGGSGQTIWTFPSSNGFKVSFCRRETELYLGGTFRPQAIWDGTNGQLIFTAGGALDVNGNRPTVLYKYQSGALIQLASGAFGMLALTSDGTNLWFTGQSADAAGTGFIPFLKKMPLSTGVISLVKNFTANYLPLRLVWNPETGKLYAGGKWFSGAPSQDSFNWQGFFASLDITGAFFVIKAFGAAGSQTAYPVEMAYQFNDKPFSIIGALANQQNGDEASDVILPNAAGVDTALINQFPFGDATGIRSNLLYVPSSDSNGNFLWSDRVYYQAVSPDQQPLIQVGIPGSWTVQATFVSQTFNFGTFSAFGDFLSSYEGDVNFFLRDAATALGLAASEISVAPNKGSVSGFSPVKPLGQWRITLNWDGGLRNTSPHVSSVEVNYFVGGLQGVRPVAEHWNGRTYFALSNPGDQQNSFVLVYDKKSAWTKYTGWRLKGIQKFRNQLTAIQDYELVQLENGTTDIGEPIIGLARTGIIESSSLTALQDISGNFGTFLNPNFQNSNAYISVTPLASEIPQADAWVFAIPALDAAMLNLMGIPLQVRPISWAKSYSLEIGTSQKSAYPAYVEQQEVIQKLSLKLAAVPVGREYAGV